MSRFDAFTQIYDDVARELRVAFEDTPRVPSLESVLSALLFEKFIELLEERQIYVESIQFEGVIEEINWLALGREAYYRKIREHAFSCDDAFDIALCTLDRSFIATVRFNMDDCRGKNILEAEDYRDRNSQVYQVVKEWRKLSSMFFLYWEHRYAMLSNSF